MKFSKENCSRKFKRDGVDGFEYNSKEQFANASAAYIEATAFHGKAKNTKCDLIYYIVDGKGEFFIEEEKYEAQKGDVIIVPKGNFYDYKPIGGVLKLFAVHTPAFDKNFEVNEINKTDE